jgi:hypothetical protein
VVLVFFFLGVAPYWWGPCVACSAPEWVRVWGCVSWSACTNRGLFLMIPSKRVYANRASASIIDLKRWVSRVLALVPAPGPDALLLYFACAIVGRVAKRAAVFPPWQMGMAINSTFPQ